MPRVERSPSGTPRATAAPAVDVLAPSPAPPPAEHLDLAPIAALLHDEAGDRRERDSVLETYRVKLLELSSIHAEYLCTVHAENTLHVQIHCSVCHWASVLCTVSLLY